MSQRKPQASGPALGSCPDGGAPGGHLEQYWVGPDTLKDAGRTPVALR